MKTKLTEKQASFIKSIEYELGITFSGETKEEASSFISEHIEEYRYERMIDECNSYSLPNQ